MSLTLTRHFSRPGQCPLDDVRWIETQAVEAPESWSATAVEIAASQYLRRRDGETSIRHLIVRVGDAITESGRAQGYFASDAQAEIFSAELRAILVGQKAAFNSPVFFNVGVFPAFGVAGQSENFKWENGRAVALSTAYVHPQASACFIQAVDGDLLSIFDLLKNEAKLFKYGSGTGTNFSRLQARGEMLRGGGESTGLISFLEVFDKAAQAVKSGGTTRRAAKMVLLDADHPEIREFIYWKMNEERKARVLMAGGFSGGMEGEALRTVSGQNSNNSVRVSDEFMRSGNPLLKDIARAAWECADPGLHFSDAVNRWHMCPEAGPIRASNPCSEFMFIDDSACNLASINLLKFLKPTGELDWSTFAHTVRVLILAQDILVDYAAYPTAKIAANSHNLRPLGLGYANLGGLLMCLGIPYDSSAAARWTTHITGAMHALALQASQDLAQARGPFAGSEGGNVSHVLAMHAKAWKENSVGALPWVSDLYAKILQSPVGLRNAQVTLIAPTGTIGLLMDCATLGIEPDFSLAKRKSLAGGGEMALVNPTVPQALKGLGYSSDAIAGVLKFMGENFHLVGAPGLKPEHLPIFDCAMAPKGFPERRVSAAGHLRVMAAAQPFLSGAISKTVNLPMATTVEEIENLYRDAWKLGLKSLAVYREGSKALQPLCAEC